MVSVALAALLAFAPAPEGALNHPTLDLRCYRLMAELASNEDPRVRAAGMTGAHYFLGRIDARSPGLETNMAGGGASTDGEREQLISRCGKVMDDAGHDFRLIGDALARASGTA